LNFTSLSHLQLKSLLSQDLKVDFKCLELDNMGSEFIIKPIPAPNTAC